MKVLIIGNYKDGTGWGNACSNYILALHAAGVKVVPRAITFNDFAGTDNVHPKVLQLEENDLHNVDVVIQHCFPHDYSYNSKFKNVGMFYSETNEIPYQWIPRLSFMDQLVVPNKHMQKSLENCNLKSDVCGIPLDYDIYQNFNPTASIDDLQTGFNFCFVGELNRRKNISALLRAFHTEFHPNENVNLFLSVSAPGLSGNKTLEEVETLNKMTTDGLGLRKNYKKIAISAGKMQHRDLLSVISQCHCFVCTSYGEAWCLPAIESMALGLPVIYTGNTGLEEFCKSGIPVSSRPEPCCGDLNNPEGIHSSLYTWNSIDVAKLQTCMRTIQESYNTNYYYNLKTKMKAEARYFELTSMGMRLKDILCQ